MSIDYVIGFLVGVVVVYLFMRRRNESNTSISMPHGTPPHSTTQNSAMIQDSQRPMQRPLSELEGEVKMYLQNGQVIEAIKFVRTNRRMGLKEAKDYVEAVRDGKSF